MIKRDYYVYILFDADGVPRLVGKGRGHRWLMHERKKLDRRNWAKYNFITTTLTAIREIPKVKIRENLTEEEAFKIEVAFITAIGRMCLGTGPLVNISDGGEGASGYKHPSRVIKHLSKKHVEFVMSLTPEERSAISKRGWNSKTPEQKASLAPRIRLTHEEYVVLGKKSAASFTSLERKARATRASHSIPPEQRRLNGLKSAMSFTPEERKARGARASNSRTMEQKIAAGRKGASALTHEQRVKAGQKGAASLTPEIRKLAGQKASDTYHRKGGKEARGFGWVIQSRWINNGQITKRLKHGKRLPKGWTYGRKS